MEAATISAVFTAAASSTYWKLVNGSEWITEVSHGGYTYYVELRKSDEPVQAEITGRLGYGGTEFLSVAATWGQTFPIVEAALNATRVH
ncbi:hypothetical protein VSR01_17260 [Actinacidiphila sp. DG2A-62]|uniref:hypothetical protein n=1 Tax=Actinacidiphila sp. DG2A-62 TaxID=3108821 RepID=UPI002DB60D7D|nr:hypothetical protein [Actinacidiphila sp. DG2A-62]MEC3995187.1 hypothetical protein [Actinacidiphila sp. DG2A-62]